MEKCLICKQPVLRAYNDIRFSKNGKEYAMHKLCVDLANEKRRNLGYHSHIEEEETDEDNSLLAFGLGIAAGMVLESVLDNSDDSSWGTDNTFSSNDSFSGDGGDFGGGGSSDDW